MADKKILILGGNGYIGSNLYPFLKEKGYDVDNVDACWFDKIYPETIVRDFKDLTKEELSEYTDVILLAGHSSVKMCEGNLTHSNNNNVQNFINLVNKLKKSTKFIYASSSSVYGNCVTIADESYDSFIPYNNYDVTKHTIDLYIQRFDIEYYGLRFGTVNGWSPIVRNDIMINSMYSSAKHNGEIKLYNKHINRAILGISDLCKSIEKIIASTEDKRGMYNIASFNTTSEEIAYEVGRLIDIPVIELEIDPTVEIINTKLQTASYDFQIDTTKFEKEFDFEFKDTIESIVNELKSKPFIETSRKHNKDYE
jgi:nucleoside-diphosphate-sugar epimerase